MIKQGIPMYPPLAIKANIEGTVVLKALVNTKGEEEKVDMLQSISMLDEAAMEAARQYKFTPAKQRDRLVKVWMSIPFRFTLHE